MLGLCLGGMVETGPTFTEVRGFPLLVDAADDLLVSGKPPFVHHACATTSNHGTAS